MNIEKLAEEKYPYAFMANKSVIDNRRKGFVEGYNYKQAAQAATKKPLDITYNDVCAVAAVLYGGGFIFTVTAIVKHNGSNSFGLTGIVDTTLWLSIHENGDFELTQSKEYAGSKEVGLNSRSVLDGYNKLKELGYEIN